MEPVRKLNNYNSYIFRHCNNHFSYIFYFFAVCSRKISQFCNSIYKLAHIFSKCILYIRQCYQCIFYNIM